MYIYPSRFIQVVFAGTMLLALIGTALPAQASPSSASPAIISASIQAKNTPPLLAEGMPTSATVSCPALTRGLVRGMRDGVTNSEILSLQKFFAARYQYAETDIATGFFGPVTESFVKKFQAEAGIEAIGIVGPRTRAAIVQACKNATSTQVEIHLNSPAASSTFDMGNAIPVSWTTSNVPKDAGMMLQLITVDTKEVVTSITVSPSALSAEIKTDEMCNGNFSDAIYAECENLEELLKDGKPIAFKIHAAVYTPKDACFGFCAPAATTTVIFGKAESPTFYMSNENEGVFTGKNTSGKAPLKTTFVINKAGTFSLDFGDGTAVQEVKNPQIMCITTPCITPAKEVTHTYRKAGTYTATLTEIIYNDCKPTDEMTCAAWFSREEKVGRVVVEVRK